MSHFPPGIIESKNETELRVKLKNGSVVQLIGSENIDSIMSTNPIGCVFAEYALQDSRAWDYIRPILVENGGWAVFDFTPRGRNHAWELFEMARRLQAEGDPDWFCQRLTVEDTGAISADQIERERREGMSPDLIEQEYYCSFSGSQQGNYYGQQLDQAEKDGRISNVPYQPELGVHTWWDLGMSDAMAITFTQNAGREVHVIDYFETSGQGLPDCARELQKKGYVYASHNAPHDIAVRELGSGKSRLETAASLGIKFEIVPNIGLQDGIDATRSFLARCWFDKVKTEQLRTALVNYHKTWDEKRSCFSNAPYHDWSSNGADSFRYLSVGHKLTRSERPQRIVPESGRLPINSTWMAS
jgi:phage terminase large subunit